FYPFIKDKDVKMYGVEAGGLGIDTDKHAASIAKGSMGVIHGMMTYLLQNEEGQILPVHSISAGLDYPGIGPEHAYFHETGRVNYVSITDNEALNAFQYLTKEEGIIPALESSHAIAYLMKMARSTNKNDIIVVNLSGRGDKDIHTIRKVLGEN
ncbi:MAG: tryptophan synthase subunit beta, partial [Tissierellia bacterium]|nr:tryptophan synthase subunit beta [Tissierellia bacterium]